MNPWRSVAEQAGESEPVPAGPPDVENDEANAEHRQALESSTSAIYHWHPEGNNKSPVSTSAATAVSSPTLSLASSDFCSVIELPAPSAQKDQSSQDEWDRLDHNDITHAQEQDDTYTSSQTYFGKNYKPPVPGGWNKENRLPPNTLRGSDKALSLASRIAPNNSAKMASDEEFHGDDWQQAGAHAAPQDLAGPGMYGRLDCTVTEPRKENEGTQNQYISYQVTTDTDFKSFQSSHITCRRRFTDFVFLYKTLCREYPQCAVPPIPDKHKMEYVRGDRFGQDFTMKRAHALQRFLKRLSLHPVLRRAVLFVLFLESSDWNATMKSRPSRGMSASEASSSGVLETWTDSFLNAFSKPHKTDRRFVEVRERADKLDDDLGTVGKTVARVARRESDLEGDYADLATQFQKLAQLEPGVQNELTSFSASIESTSQDWRKLREHTDQDYLGSLRDMEAYCTNLKTLLKTREQKQLDFEGLTEYQNKAANERDNLASNANMGASGFIRAKIEDVRGVDHEASRRERVRKLEVQIRRLQDEVEGAKKTTEAFDEEVVKEVSDFERIKAVEFRDTLGGLADANIDFFKGQIDTWEKFIKDMEKQETERTGGE